LINEIRVRIYKPKLGSKNGEKMPIMVYYHGGGFAFGGLGKFKGHLKKLI
jgi:acetyl esterase/lipase